MPPIERVVETAIYADDLNAAEQFYRDTLGLEPWGKAAGRHVFFRVGDSMLLVFRAEETRAGDMLPGHGASGAGHFALGIATEDLAVWRERLQRAEVTIEREIAWPAGGHSLYFRDPAGNSVELLTRGVWGLPSGW